MHRTTIEFDDKLLGQIKAICRREGSSLKGLVLELVRRGLKLRAQKGAQERRSLKQWHTAPGPLPRGIDPADRTTYLPLVERPLP